MLSRLAPLPILLAVSTAQPSLWQEFSIGPAEPKQNLVNDYRRGVLHAGSISLKSLIGIAAGAPDASFWARTGSTPNATPSPPHSLTSHAFTCARARRMMAAWRWNSETC